MNSQQFKEHLESRYKINDPNYATDTWCLIKTPDNRVKVAIRSLNYNDHRISHVFITDDSFYSEHEVEVIDVSR